MKELQLPELHSKSARGNEIINILLRHDFWGLLRSLMSGKPQKNASGPPEERVRKILEELGPTFIKLGQLLATRPDLVPTSYVQEFKTLYDGTKANPLSLVSTILEKELGKPIGELFQSIDPTPLGSASVGQVHKAILLDGREVAVKIQHPGIEERMRVDFQILRGILGFIEKTFAASRLFQPTRHLDELEQMMERELDYTFEMRNTQRVAHNFRHDNSVKIPHVYEEFCTRRILTMEFIPGIKFTKPETLDKHGIDRKNVAKLITTAMAKQIFLDRVFHADPSPGNMMILSSNQVAFLDFGAVGIVTERRAKSIFRMIVGISRKNLEDTSEAVLELCEQLGEHDPKAYQTDVEKLLDYFEQEEVSVADPRVMEVILGIAKTHKMLLPADFMLVSRALFQFDGFCRELDPDFDLVDVLDPLVGEIIWKNITNTKKQRELIEETIGELIKFVRHSPHTLNQVLRRIERNEIRTTLDIAGLESIKSSYGRGVLKMAFSVIMASLVIGLAIVYTGNDPESRVGQFMFGAGAIVIAWTMVLIVWSEAFKGRRENE